MTRKKILTICVATLSMIGMLFASFPLFSSLMPSATAGANLPQYNLRDMAAGTYQYIDTNGDYSVRWLVIKQADNSVKVFNIPMTNDGTTLPDKKWFRWGGVCSDFRPETENGFLTSNGTIKCHDEMETPWYADSHLEWQWTYTGENLGKYTQDMQSPRYVVENDYLIIGKY